MVGVRVLPESQAVWSVSFEQEQENSLKSVLFLLLNPVLSYKCAYNFIYVNLNDFAA